MATGSSDHSNGCTFQFEIENVSYCWLKKGQCINSPAFVVDAVQGTKWALMLYLRGHEDENFISIYVGRLKDCSGPAAIECSYKMSILDKNNSILISKGSSCTNRLKGGFSGFAKFETRKKVFETERKSFLPGDTLKVQCSVWKYSEQPAALKLLYGRTVFQAERMCFSWKIDKFNDLKAAVRNNYTIINKSVVLMNFDLVLNKQDSGKTESTLDINIHSFAGSITYFMFKASIVGPKTKKVDCGKREFFSSDLKKGMLPMLTLPKDILERKKNLYMPNDALFLDCEYTYSTGTVLSEVVESVANSSSVFLKTTDELTSLESDLKSMYTDAIHSDTELRTPTQTFQVHKTILSARSPVFRSMFDHDMKEKLNGHIDVTDLEDDTVHRMLLYVYTDCLGDLQFDSACKLYAAADKYEIMSLRSECSSFLRDNMCPKEVCDILVLADTHQDSDLKSAVQDYIKRNHKEIFFSKQWKHFMSTNVVLAAEVMYRNFCSGEALPCNE